MSHSKNVLRYSSKIQVELVIFSWVVEAMIDLKMGRVIFEVSNQWIHDLLIHQETVPEFNEWIQEFNEWIHKTHNSLLSFEVSCLNWVTAECNQMAMEISKSVIRDRKCQSYVAFQGPVWLQARILWEASEAV